MENGQRQKQMQMRGSLHCGGKSAAFGRDDGVFVVGVGRTGNCNGNCNCNCKSKGNGKSKSKSKSRSSACGEG
jgi:hypothetical protein